MALAFSFLSIGDRFYFCRRVGPKRSKLQNHSTAGKEAHNHNAGSPVSQETGQTARSARVPKVAVERHHHGVEYIDIYTRVIYIYIYVMTLFEGCHHGIDFIKESIRFMTFSGS